ncbi:50S ribosomal protein L31 [Buchnera aphidicola (Schlechtendalia chinensis)]|uniref:Large ribosomal subunit protein bL31 n=1 Tax=Buchnera aphidicola subsp. Schlechtendalia chinensis TaxID=118110 RepID=A0A172WE61_BUCSC|nr:50S ribosomal protein L31 [Buchnera aphidicola]ANF17268.1 50S ribosomal protein L31 [Buchnera aphidicola (Schlechtendalia chinensis)]
MKDNIHPNYFKISIFCSCGNSIETFSTLCKNINIDVCSKCHPFYTGKQRVADIGGRIEKFNKKFNINDANR